MSMKTIDFSYFIERYISGEMKEAEKVWFEKELDSRPSLKAEIDLRKRTDEVLRNQDVLNLRNKLAEIEKQRAAAEPVRRRKSLALIRNAAAIFIVASLGTILFSGLGSLTTDEIIAKYYSRYETISSTRSASGVTSTDYATAMEYYNVHDYKNAALFFSKAINSDNQYIESTFMHGVSNFEDRNYPVASESFTKVIENNDNLFLEDAELYLAYCYLKTGNSAKAEPLLRKISESSSLHSRVAGRLLKKLNHK
jgi:tetratricopeptide (TPR) repeat protein